MNSKISNLKLFIIDYYESLIRQVDIHAEEQLEKYNENDLLPETTPSTKQEFNAFYNSLNIFTNYTLNDLYEKECIEANKDPFTNVLELDSSQNDERFKPGLTKVHDFVNLVRNELINELRQCLDGTLKHYEMIKNEIEIKSDVRKIERQLFSKKFCLLVKSRDHSLLRRGHRIVTRSSPFRIYLFVLDFYIEPSVQEFIRLEFFDIFFYKKFFNQRSLYIFWSFKFPFMSYFYALLFCVCVI